MIRSRRRTVALVINEEAKLIVRAPLRLPEREIFAFIDRQRSWIERKQAELAARPQPRILTAQERAEARQQAEVKLRERCRYFTELTGLRPKSVRITSAIRRWGSCGAKGTINFSWRLALVPEAVADYVVVHELVHLVEPNHSRSFWAKVRQVMPDFRARRRWLRENGERVK